MTPILIIQRRSDVYAVVEIGVDETTPTLQPTKSNRFAIRGEVAELLYMALAGHRFGTAPERARPGLALHVRALIQERQALQGWYYAVAYYVVHCFGPFIMPWLGVLKTRHGKAVLNDPIYQERIKL